MRDEAAVITYASAPGEVQQDYRRRLDTKGLAHLGLLCSVPEAPALTVPFGSNGREVAATEFVRAVLEHGRANRATIFVQPEEADPCSPGLRSLTISRKAAFPPELQICPVTLFREALQRHPVDVLHETGGLSLLQAAYARACLAAQNFPITTCQYGLGYPILLYGAYIPLLTTPLRECDAIVCSGTDSKKALEARLSHIVQEYTRCWQGAPPRLPRLEVIPWGVDTARFRPLDAGEARRDLGLAPDRPVILCIGRGRIQDTMDWTTVLIAFQDLIRQCRQRPQLVLGGAVLSDYADHVLACAAELDVRPDVRTFFNLPGASLPTLYAACDLLLSPVDTISESYGLTLAEAMASGRPVVAADWNGYRDQVVHGETGFRVQTRWADCLGEMDVLSPLLSTDLQHLHVAQSISVNIPELVQYARRLLESRELRKGMGEKARRRAVERYDWRVVIAQWDELWHELRGIADGVQGQDDDHLSYLRPTYFEHFYHYASRIIDESVPVYLTERGKQAVSGNYPIMLYPGARHLLQSDCLRAALQGLRPAAWMGVGLPVSAVLSMLCKDKVMSRERALMHLMWLAKYDLISLEEPPRQAEESSLL